MCTYSILLITEAFDDRRDSVDVCAMNFEILVAFEDEIAVFTGLEEVNTHSDGSVVDRGYLD